MEKFIKKAAIILVLVSVTTVVFADRGTGKKSKVKTTLNINSASSTLKGSILSNIKNGLAYKGSFLAPRQINNSVITNNTDKDLSLLRIPFTNKSIATDFLLLKIGKISARIVHFNAMSKL